MYAVDEWLRFKSGQSRGMMVLKGALGTVWFFVAYVHPLLREPAGRAAVESGQARALGHGQRTRSCSACGRPWACKVSSSSTECRAWATSTFAAIVTLTPGIFGYLIWELKENWRLFAANRSQDA